MEKLKKIGLWLISTLWGRLIIGMSILIISGISYWSGANDLAMYGIIGSFGFIIVYILYGFGWYMYNEWKENKRRE